MDFWKLLLVLISLTALSFAEENMSVVEYEPIGQPYWFGRVIDNSRCPKGTFRTKNNKCRTLYGRRLLFVKRPEK